KPSARNWLPRPLPTRSVRRASGFVQTLRQGRSHSAKGITSGWPTIHSLPGHPSQKHRVSGPDDEKRRLQLKRFIGASDQSSDRPSTSFLQPRRPVLNQREWFRRLLLNWKGDQKALSIGRDIIGGLTGAGRIQ